MTRSEIVMLGVAFAGLAAIVIYQRPLAKAVIAENPVPNNISLTPDNTNMTQGPSYLMFNSPWAFAPPVGNFLPNTTVGEIGQVSEPMRIASECGCA